MNIDQTTSIDLQDPLEQINIVHISLYNSDEEDIDINIAEDDNTKRQPSPSRSPSFEYDTSNEEKHSNDEAYDLNL